MGNYTGVRCKVIIKPEYRKEMEHLSSDEVQYEWSESNIDFMREYGDYSRATFIPRGGLSYMPDEWDDNVGDFDRKYVAETGLWTFQCSLKNYESTIQYFFDNVLSKITQEVLHLEYYYEEMETSRMYELVDDKIVESSKEGITYRQYY